MLADTLVTLDYDMKTIQPGVAESWSVSPDGLVYTFNLRKDVKFCDGKPMKAEDVVYSLKRWINPETKSPVRWRAGKVADIVAKDDYTVDYKLSSPYSEMLYQLTQSFAVIVDKDNVAKLGPDFGVKGFNGTGPFCWVDWSIWPMATLICAMPVDCASAEAAMAPTSWLMPPKAETMRSNASLVCPTRVTPLST